MINFTFEEMFNGIELLTEISHCHYSALRCKGIDDEIKIMQIDDWKVCYIPSKHFNVRVGERMEKFPPIPQYKCASTYFKNIKHFNEGYGRINGMLMLFGYKKMPLNTCIMLPYEIQYDSIKKVAEVVAKTTITGYPTKGEKVTKDDIKYEDIIIVSADTKTTGINIPGDIYLRDNVMVGNKTYQRNDKLIDLIPQTTFIPWKVNFTSVLPLSDADKQPDGIAFKYTKNG